MKQVKRPKTMFLSFWDVALSNFTEGTFRKRVLTSAQARLRIDTARAAGQLVWVAPDASTQSVIETGSHVSPLALWSRLPHRGLEPQWT